MRKGILMSAGGENGQEFWEEMHGSFSNLVIVLAILHVRYPILYRLPLARFMVYRDHRARHSE
jgi:hypothetical protein